MGWHHAHSASIQKCRGTTLTGQHHIAGIPTEFVMPWIVVGGRCDKASTIRGKPNHFSTSLPNLIDDLHGTHVIDAGIEPQLVEDQNTGLASITVQRLHCRRNVARCNDINTCVNGNTSHFHMHRSRQHTDNQICTCDS